MIHNSLHTSLAPVGEYEDTTGQAFMNALIMPLEYREIFCSD